MRVTALLCACAIALAAPTAGALTQEESDVLQRGLTETADNFVLPAYEAHADAASALAERLGAYCDGAGEIAPAREAFVATFLSWQRASIVQFGPVAKAEGPMRVQLWPDPKGFARRAVRTAVRQEDPALTAAGGLEGRSIALTNLTALEDLLFGELAPEGYACDLARAIALFQSNLADDLVAAWTPGSDFRRDYDSAAAGNQRYASVETLLREFLAGTVVYVDRLRKFKLLRGLGEEPGKARAERTEARLSDAGLASIEASLRTLADLYALPYGLFDIAPDVGGTMDYLTLSEGAASLADTLATQPGSLAAIADEDGARAAELRSYADFVLSHEAFLKTGFLDALGLTAGFTAADGD